MRTFEAPLILLFGFVLRGLPAVIVQFVLCGWSVALGFGLLRGRYGAWIAAVIYVVFGGANAASIGLFLNAETFQEIFQGDSLVPFEQPSPEFMCLASWLATGGLLFSGLLLGLLMRYRRWFLSPSSEQEIVDS